jgi:hypothetical protein
MDKFHKSFGDCQGPLGFPMHSAAAKALERILAGLNADCKSFLAQQEGGLARRAKLPTAVELHPDEGVDVSTINTATLDLDKEVVLPSGGDWETVFGKNGGQVTWCHQYSQIGVGRCLWMVPTWERRRAASISYAPADAWKASTEYHPRPGKEALPEGQPWFPGIVKYLVMERGLKGKSIGFLPTEMRRPTKEDVAAVPQLAEASFFIAKWIGLEYAVAPIQCNPDAVRELGEKARADGIEIPAAIFKSFGVIVPGFGSDPEPETRHLEPDPQIFTIPQLEAMVGQRLKNLDLGAIVAGAVDRLRGRV